MNKDKRSVYINRLEFITTIKKIINLVKSLLDQPNNTEAVETLEQVKKLVDNLLKVELS